MSRAVLPIAVFAGAALLYGLCAYGIPFYNKGEPREALVVRAVLSGDSIILPLRDGREVPSKPPFFHWLAASAVRAGVEPEELAVRLPSVLCGAATVALSGAAAAHWYGPAAGWVAAAVLGSSFEWLRTAIQARVDITLVFLVSVAVFAWRAGVMGAGGRWAVRGGYLVAAAAVLTKGPVGIAIPVLVMGVLALVEREPRRLLRLFDPVGVGVVSLLCGGWYGLAWLEGGDAFVARQLFHENLQRFMGSGGGGSHGKPFYQYVLLLPASYFPWTLALPPALWRAWRERDRASRFLLVWIVTVFVFYSIAAGKRPAYLLALFPPLAILTGEYLVCAFAAGAGRFARGVLWTTAAVLGVVVALLIVGDDAQLVALLEGRMKPRELARVATSAALVVAYRWQIVAVFGSIAVMLWRLGSPQSSERRWRATALLCGVAIVWSVGLTGFGTYPLAVARTLRPFAARVHAVVEANDRLWSLGYVQYGLRYYLGRPMSGWTKRQALADVDRQFVVAAVTGDEMEARRPLVLRLIDLRRHARLVVGLYEVRGEDGVGQTTRVSRAADH